MLFTTDGNGCEINFVIILRLTYPFLSKNLEGAYGAVQKPEEGLDITDEKPLLLNRL